MRATLKFFAATLILASLVSILPFTTKAHFENTYFPLHVGNQWNYVKTGPLIQGSENVTFKVDAWWQHPNTQQMWFRLLNYNGKSHWVTQNRAGVIREWKNLLWYRLNGAVGSSWTMEIKEQPPTSETEPINDLIACSNGAKLEIVSRNEMITVPAGTFSTVHIKYTTLCMDGGLADEWFAEGVGLVQRAEQSWGGQQLTKLQGAIICGRIIGPGAN
jgi:hypothetical protein